MYATSGGFPSHGELYYTQLRSPTPLDAFYPKAMASKEDHIVMLMPNEARNTTSQGESDPIEMFQNFVKRLIKEALHWGKKVMRVKDYLFPQRVAA